MPEIEQEISEVANTLLREKARITLLEAGCGSSTHIHFNPEIHAIGIDISSVELEKNTSVHERIVGDIQEYMFPNEAFDVVICWNVLEHLAKPKQALLNLGRAVRPGGLLILGFPNLLSIKGLVTRFTPFWFHTLYYRHMGFTFRPFPTFLRSEGRPSNVVRVLTENGFSLEFYKLVEGRTTRKARARSRIVNCVFLMINAASFLVSFGKITSPLLDNCGIVAKKQRAHA